MVCFRMLTLMAIQSLTIRIPLEERLGQTCFTDTF